jgi:hypothetical protein
VLPLEEPCSEPACPPEDAVSGPEPPDELEEDDDDSLPDDCEEDPPDEEEPPDDEDEPPDEDDGDCDGEDGDDDGEPPDDPLEVEGIDGLGIVGLGIDVLVVAQPLAAIAAANTVSPARAVDRFINPL